jgi:signal transduction histidine kinase/ActR/RegA family two-component response regulator
MLEANAPVLVLAPTGRDAELIAEALRRAQFPTEICSNLEQFAFHLKQGAAVGLLAQEALANGTHCVLDSALREQPAWSDIPLILMTNRRALNRDLTQLIERSGNVTVLERPVRLQTLVTAIGSAIRHRSRQYELRDRLEDQQRTEERLRQTQKLESLGILAGGIAHDFNNLLTGVIGNINLALDLEPPMSPQRRYLDDALHASDRAADLTRQLLAYSGKGRFSIQLLDLSAVVREISALIQSSIPKNVQVMLKLADGPTYVTADAAQLQQIVMNLIINGAEAIGRETDGLVVVETGLAEVDEDYLRTTLAADGAHPGEYVYLEVRDTGCGIDEATLSKIFDPFFTTKFMGRGLGLAAVLGIVRGHEGALKVESTPGRGASFRVLFPATHTAAHSGSHSKDSSRQTILVVDDEEIVRKIAKHTLQNCGYRVLLAENGQVAMEVFAKEAAGISLVLLDLTMPVMNGEQTFHRLQRIRPDVKVILTSGYGEADVMGRFAGTAMAGFLQKPYTATHLSQIVKRILTNQAEPASA